MTTWDYQEKSNNTDGGWTYDEANLGYDDLVDPDSGLPVYYDGFGLSPTWSLLSKTISLLITLSIIN